MNFAVLFQACLAARAHSAGIHETADSGKLPDFESFHPGPDACHASDNFVAWDHWENRATPLIPRLMDVRVADPAVKDFNQHIVWTWIAPFKVERFENRCRTFGCVSTCRYHVMTSYFSFTFFNGLQDLFTRHSKHPKGDRMSMSSFQSDLMKLLQGANHVLCPIGWDDRKDDQIISGEEERDP